MSIFDKVREGGVRWAQWAMSIAVVVYAAWLVGPMVTELIVNTDRRDALFGMLAPVVGIGAATYILANGLLKYLKFASYSSGEIARLEEKTSETLKAQVKLRDEALRVFLEQQKIGSETSSKPSIETISELFQGSPSVPTPEMLRDEVDNRFSATIRRLRDEIDSLRVRGNLNLIIGTVASAIAIGGLGFLVLSTDQPSFSTWPDMVRYYGVRLSLAVFIEVLSYFFLRLYRSSLSEIKYYQNELSNIELKQAGLTTAMSLNLMPAAATAIQDLCTTERNFILKKDETTVEIEKARIERQFMKDATETVSTFAQKFKQ